MERITHTPIKVERFSKHESCIGLTVKSRHHSLLTSNNEEKSKYVITKKYPFLKTYVKAYAYCFQFSDHKTINIEHHTFCYKNLQSYQEHSPPRSCQWFCYIYFYNLHCMFCYKILQTCLQDILQCIAPSFCHTV